MKMMINILIFLNLITFGLFIENDGNHLKDSEAYLMENSLQPSEHDVQLEEFFWTGSGDGPSYTKPKDPSDPSKHPNTIIRTATILATVYIDGDNGFDTLCGGSFDCDDKSEESDLVTSFDDIARNDRRYWLLTVVAGLFEPQDFPILEKKLAKLYRIAFMRQQAKHLGFENGNATAVTNVTETPERRRKRSTPASEVVSPDDVIKTRPFVINKFVYERQMLRMKRQKVPAKLQMQPPHASTYTTFDKKKKLIASNDKNLLRKVNIRIHKLAHGDAENVSDENKIDLMLPTTVDKNNSTEIIYSVIVNGKAVLATTAAEDMRLVKLDEVNKIMENDVVLKAEPYLRETAMPSKSPMDGSITNISSFDTNPLLIAFISIAFVLFILLLVVLLLYGRSKRRLAMEMKRHSTSQDLVRSDDAVDEDLPTINSGGSIDGIGVDNLAFEKENCLKKDRDIPVIHFPLPPANRPSSESSGTSDSSLYFPKKPYKFNSVQDLLSYNGKHKDMNDDDKHQIYAKLKVNSSAEKLKRKDTNNKIHNKKQGRQRRKRRVGSVEHVDVHHYQEDEIEAFDQKRDNEFDIRKSKGQTTISIIEEERKRKGGDQHVEAINKNLIIQRTSGASTGRVNSAESNSIGSYLSMASLKSFPKCIVPEPLSRVLEPVSVTHLDHSDADYETLKNSRLHDSQKSLYISYSEDELKNIKADSDGGDPGVVGPAVWEMHKKSRLSSNLNDSPLRDPTETRNRFEDLLDGAMKLYSSSSYSNCYSLMNETPTNDDAAPGSVKAKDISSRGKSAATIRLTSRTSGLLSKSDYSRTRPMTADPGELPENPIPTIEAWQSKSNSNLVRPLSAGIYHKPHLTIPEEVTMADDLSKSRATRAMSASPIIDAIQKELKRISNEEK